MNLSLWTYFFGKVFINQIFLIQYEENTYTTQYHTIIHTLILHREEKSVTIRKENENTPGHILLFSYVLWYFVHNIYIV